MKPTMTLLGLFGLAVFVLPAAPPLPQALNPVGSYAVATADEGGVPLSGTLTIRAGEAGEYVGEFVGADGEVVPVRQVATNGRHLMAMVETGAGLAVAWLQRQDDTTLTGTWHQLGAGIRVKATKRGDGGGSPRE